MKRILILAAGSRGDVQPFIALGHGLQRAGYAVTICTSTRFGEWVARHGIEHAPMDDGLLQLGETQAGRAALEGGSRLSLIKQVRPLLRRMLDDAWAAAPGADAIVYHPKALAGYHVAEKLNVPAILSIPVPLFTPTRAFPNPLLPDINIGGWFNRLSYRLTALAALPYAGLINRWRAEVLGIRPRSRFASELVRPDGTPMPVLYPFSQHVVPRPSDWPSTTVVTGYWFLDEQQDWHPPSALIDFLDAGPPPIYIGFGSMAGRDPARLTDTIVGALERSGQRGIVATGWGGLSASDVPPHVYVIDAAPHDWLFPRCAAVVHHGGAGTTAAGLRAGKPTIICPWFGDQPFWGRRVHALGVGPKPIPRRKLSIESLADAIRTATIDTSMQQRAHELAMKLRSEDGVGQAVAFIKSQLE